MPVRDEWMVRYMPLLQAAGAGLGDIWASASLGWYIAALDEMTFGRSGVALVNFDVLPPEHEEVPYAIASYERDDTYRVFPTALLDKLLSVIGRLGLAGSLREQIERLLLSIGAHEVRHRVQHVYPAVRLFDRQRRRQERDPLTRSVMEAVHREFLNEKRFRDAFPAHSYYPEELCLGAREYDATVIEHLIQAAAVPDPFEYARKMILAGMPEQGGARDP